MNCKCTICGYVIAGEQAPVHCPECGARTSMFEATAEAPHGIQHNPFQPHDHELLGDILGPGDAGCMDSD